VGAVTTGQVGHARDGDVQETEEIRPLPAFPEAPRNSGFVFATERCVALAPCATHTPVSVASVASSVAGALLVAKDAYTGLVLKQAGHSPAGET